MLQPKRHVSRPLALQSTGPHFFRHLAPPTFRGTWLNDPLNENLKFLPCRYDLVKGGYDLVKGGYDLVKGGYDLVKGGYDLVKGLGQK